MDTIVYPMSVLESKNPWRVKGMSSTFEVVSLITIPFGLEAQGTAKYQELMLCKVLGFKRKISRLIPQLIYRICTSIKNNK